MDLFHLLTTLTKGKNFSPSFGGLMVPLTVSPVFKPNSFVDFVKHKYHREKVSNYNLMISGGYIHPE